MKTAKYKNKNRKTRTKRGGQIQGDMQGAMQSETQMTKQGETQEAVKPQENSKQQGKGWTFSLFGPSKPSQQGKGFFGTTEQPTNPVQSKVNYDTINSISNELSTLAEKLKSEINKLKSA
jgi:hypothetical protein